jgi:hypothetical protein
MKRRQSLPLFQTLEPDVYLFDTSAWLNIEPRRDCENVWVIITALINTGRLFSCAQVFEELRDDPIYARLYPYKNALQVGDHDSDDPAYLQQVGRITHDYPSMSKARGRKNPADPYIVALAELEKYIVVADETTKRPNRKIPGVCHQRGIRCLNLDEFIRAVSGTNPNGRKSG